MDGVARRGIWGAWLLLAALTADALAQRPPANAYAFAQPAATAEALGVPPVGVPAPSAPPVQMPVSEAVPAAPIYPYQAYPSNSTNPFDPYAPTPEPSLASELFGFDGFSKVTSDESRRQNLSIFHGYSSWRGISEGSGGNNNGFLYGMNLGSRLGEFSDYTGIGAQIGASYGLYDLNGRNSGFNNDQVQQQTFITAGLFRRADEWTNFSAGVAFDAMFNDNFGQFAVSPFLGQLRAQVAYALNDRHELGFWTALRMVDDTKNVGGPLQYRGVDQFNFFWHHKFAFGADGWSWIGFPDNRKLGDTGSLGNYIFGGMLYIPLSPWFGGYTDLQYMPPTAAIGASAANQESFAISLGIILYPTRGTQTNNVAGHRWAPYMPVANNGTFIVDTNRTF